MDEPTEGRARDDVTTLLLQMQERGATSDPRLDPLVYAELRRIADRLMRGERATHTLQATALVNEAWIRLVDSTRVNEASRSVFLGLAARTMRRVLVDHARARNRQKRGGGDEWQRITLSAAAAGTGPDYDLLALDEALTQLQELSPRRAFIVEMRYFGGMTMTETAEALGLTEYGLRIDWLAARAWLATRLRD